MTPEEKLAEAREKILKKFADDMGVDAGSGYIEQIRNDGVLLNLMELALSEGMRIGREEHIEELRRNDKKGRPLGYSVG